MRFLILDTSTEHSALALSEGLTPIEQCYLPPGYQSSKFLFSSLLELLNRQMWRLESLAAIVVSSGPGSFTGIRVGVAAAFGLAFSTGIPLIEFCSLEGYTTARSPQFISIIDAKMGGVHVLFQKKVGDTFHIEQGPLKLSIEDLKRVASPTQCFVGPNCAQLQKKCEEHPGWTWIDASPDLAHISRLAHEKYRLKEYNYDQSLLIKY